MMIDPPRYFGPFTIVDLDGSLNPVFNMDFTTGETKIPVGMYLNGSILERNEDATTETTIHRPSLGDNAVIIELADGKDFGYAANNGFTVAEELDY
jgi:hypothetical protein